VAAPAKPAALKLLNGRGNGKDSAGREINMGPAFVRDAPEPPSWLDREAKAEWRRVVPELDRLNLLARVTRSSLVGYCQTWSMYVTAIKELQQTSMFYEAKQGLIPHPAVNTSLKCSAELRRWAVEYGMTPASEQKIKPQETPDDGRLDAIS